MIAPVANAVPARCLRELEEAGMVLRLNHNAVRGVPPDGAGGVQLYRRGREQQKKTDAGR